MEMCVADATRSLESRLPDWKLAYRVDEACASTGYGRSKVWEMIRQGKLKAKKDGGVTVILRGDLNAYLNNLADRQADGKARP